MDLFSRVLDKYRTNKHQKQQYKIDAMGALQSDSTVAEKLYYNFAKKSDLEKTEKDAILHKFDEEQLAALLRADCIRQARPWDAPGTNQEVVSEVIAQLKLVTQASHVPTFVAQPSPLHHRATDEFLLLDYHVKLLRPYSQLWNSPGVEEAVVDAVKLVGEAVKVMKTLKMTRTQTKRGHVCTDYEPAAGKWAHFFFFSRGAMSDVGDDGVTCEYGYGGSAIEKAVAQFNDMCEKIIAANHKEEGLCGKRNREAFEEDFVERV